MKLLILTQKLDNTDDDLGFFHEWIEEFTEQCEQVTVICLFKGDYNFPDNVKILSLGKEGGVSRIKYLFRFYAFVLGGGCLGENPCPAPFFALDTELSTEKPRRHPQKSERFGHGSISSISASGPFRKFVWG